MSWELIIECAFKIIIFLLGILFLKDFVKDYIESKAKLKYNEYVEEELPDFIDEIKFKDKQILNKKELDEFRKRMKKK